MENHPIPQDITGFQFKLIGNMTVKQFVYLAVGAFFAWLFFFIIKPPPIVKWPLSFISLGIGATLAFVPVDGRPMDVMLGNFIKALLSPSQFIYKKGGGIDALVPTAQKDQIPQPPTQTQMPKEAEMPSITLQAPMPITPPVPEPAPAPTPVLTNPELVPAPSTPAAPPPPPSIVNLPTPTPSPVVSITPDPTNMPTSVIEELNKPAEEKLRQKELEIDRGEKEYLQKQVDDLRKQLEESKTQTAAPVTQVAPPAAQLEQSPDQASLEKMLAESVRQKEALEKQILQMRAKAEGPKQTFNPSVAAPLPRTQRVRSVPFGMEKTVGIPSVPEAPNLITGIVKDPRGNPLANILIEVKDQDANPVRAFKTNGLGKFASATSLSNGKYLITFEDPAETNKFDAVQLDLQGAPVMPLEIISVDPREELRRELFN